MENQISYIVKTETGKLEICRHALNGGCGPNVWINQREMPRNEFALMWLGEQISWNKSDFNMTKVEGTIIAKKVCDWDYSEPIGKRCKNLKQTSNYEKLLREYRNNS